MKSNYIDENMKKLIILNHLYEIEKLIESKQKINNENLEIEKEIINVALSYENGIYRSSSYISPNRAYSIVLKSAREKNETSIKLYSEKVKQEIENITNVDTHNTDYLINFIKSIIKDFTKDKRNIRVEGTNKVYGLL